MRREIIPLDLVDLPVVDLQPGKQSATRRKGD